MKITNEKQYRDALSELKAIFHSNNPRCEDLEKALKVYENDHYRIGGPTPEEVRGYNDKHGEL
jgi:antitoxin component HigA of HigAB toxin-antitoxin module